MVALMDCYHTGTVYWVAADWAWKCFVDNNYYFADEVLKDCYDNMVDDYQVALVTLQVVYEMYLSVIEHDTRFLVAMDTVVCFLVQELQVRWFDELEELVVVLACWNQGAVV